METEDQRSRFICTLAPVDTVAAASAFVEAVSAEFSDATHNCWAYVVGPPGSTTHVGMSDDGEPHNTAGRPMLNVLLHADVGDVAAVVTRYFGGTKLGRGGLVRAYGGAVQVALDAAERTERVAWVPLVLELEYGLLSAVERLYETFEVKLDDAVFGASITHRVRLPDERQAAFVRAIQDVSRGRVRIDDDPDSPSNVE